MIFRGRCNTWDLRFLILGLLRVAGVGMNALLDFV